MLFLIWKIKEQKEKEMRIETLKAMLGSGRMASVDFVTKTGRERTINGRTGVRKYVTGRGKNRVSGNQLVVWETLRPQDKEREGQKRYRTITLDNVKAIRADGLEIRVNR